jgi:hypothetical protein
MAINAHRRPSLHKNRGSRKIQARRRGRLAQFSALLRYRGSTGGHFMNSPPAARPDTQPSIRLDEKQGRVEVVGRGVRIVSASGAIVTNDQGTIRRYLNAANAQPIRSHAGRLVAIKVHSFGDDRGHSGEQHGRSTITTRMEALSGSISVCQHKQQICLTWPQPIGKELARASKEQQIREEARVQSDAQLLARRVSALSPAERAEAERLRGPLRAK